MAHSNPDTIEIIDESVDGEERHQLYIDGQRRAVVTRVRNVVHLNWQVYGPQRWPEAEVLMKGLLELSVIANKLAGEYNDK